MKNKNIAASMKLFAIEKDSSFSSKFA